METEFIDVVMLVGFAGFILFIMSGYHQKKVEQMNEKEEREKEK
jgi:hypothetical protein